MCMCFIVLLLLGSLHILINFLNDSNFTVVVLFKTDTVWQSLCIIMCNIIIIIKNEKIRVALYENSAGALYVVDIK